MEERDVLIVGAGVSGLAFANALWARAQKENAPLPNIQILDRDKEPGGYCKTVKRSGFVWDYSGHFFHFRFPEIETWLRERMATQNITTIDKKSFIRFKKKDIDFPFQKNIHQLPQEDFVECLVDLYEASHQPASSLTGFKEKLYADLGCGICDKFLIPYNEKLYACDLATLDVNAMGRFFPQADLDSVIQNMRVPDNTSYNSTFTYPEKGAFEYIKALLRDLSSDMICLEEELLEIDLDKHVAITSKREIHYKHLVSSSPLPQLANMTKLKHDPDIFRCNKVLVFNLGFDAKGPTNVHWIYVPDKNRRFYRVGFYDNIHQSDKMSLYVEIGASQDEVLDIDQERERVLQDLRAENILTNQNLVDHHHVILDPAYVHITETSIKVTQQIKAQLANHNVHSIGRYGSWTYCSIEDNIIEARQLASSWIL